MGFEIVQAGDTAENVFLLYFVIKSLIQSLWENPETTSLAYKCAKNCTNLQIIIFSSWGISSP